MPRVIGKNKDEVGSVGAVSENLDPFYENSPSDHQHQYVENARLLVLLGSFVNLSYPPCRIFAIGNSVFLHGIVANSVSETDICQIPREFLPGVNKLPLFLLNPQTLTSGSEFTQIFIDTDGILKFDIANIWTAVDLSILRYVKE